MTLTGKFARAVRARLNDLFVVSPDLAGDALHARKRKVRLVYSAGMSLVAKIISVATAFITVPLTLHYLGPERYGMWMVMSSLLAMLAFADLGIGNGVLNSVAAAYGRDDRSAIREASASGMAILAVIALVLLAAFMLAYPFIAWERLFNVKTAGARAEAGPAVLAFFVCFAIAIPVNVVQKVQAGLQRGFLASSWSCAGSVLSLCFVLLVVHWQGGLVELVVAFLAGPLIANLANTVVFFGFQHRDIAPRLSAVSRQAARHVLQTGLLFLVMQITTALIFNADSLIITQVIGPAAVPEYSIPDRMFSVIPMCIQMLLTPLWPAYREALSRNDHAWCIRVVRRSMLTAVGGAAVMALGLVIFGKDIIHLWVGGGIAVPMIVLVGFGLWKVIEAAGFAMAMFLNGAHVIREQVWTAVATALAVVVFEIAMVRALGVPGAIWAKIGAYLLFTVLPFLFLTPGILRRLRNTAEVQKVAQ